MHVLLALLEKSLELLVCVTMWRTHVDRVCLVITVLLGKVSSGPRSGRQMFLAEMNSGSATPRGVRVPQRLSF